jgi:hypothetical protein
MKVFQVDEVSWYAGSTAQEAVDAYVADIGTDEARELCAEFGEPQEISEADLDRLTITDVDDPGQPKRTFREALAQRTTPGFIATTEY